MRTYLYYHVLIEIKFETISKNNFLEFLDLVQILLCESRI